MGKFNDRKKFGHGGKFGGNRGGFGGGRGGFGGGRDGGRPQMHKATCSECGNECELPFRPSGDRPVFCSTCFDKQGGGKRESFGGNKFGGGERRERTRFEEKHMHDAVCVKCGKACQVPFKPMPGKDVFCDNCFDKGGSKDSGELMAEIKGLHVKIDRLMKLLASGTPEIKEAKPRTERSSSTGVKKVAVKKVAAKKKK